jgi:hypothetical protein
MAQPNGNVPTAGGCGSQRPTATRRNCRLAERVGHYPARIASGEGIAAGEVGFPEYLPQGEFRVLDPDGYTLMIAQSGDDTP